MSDVDKIIGSLIPRYNKEGSGKSPYEFKIIYDSSTETLEPIYFWDRFQKPGARYMASRSFFSVWQSDSTCFCICLTARPSAILKKPPTSP